MQEEGIPPREASWVEEDIIQDSEEESDHDLHAAGLVTLKCGPESHKVNIC